jgi:predicted deacylase
LGTGAQASAEARRAGFFAEVADFAALPVLINSSLRDGSLRECAAEAGIPMLLYEAGEALRYDEIAIRAGVQGVLNVMRTLEMLPPSPHKRPEREPFIAGQTHWQRAPETGMLRSIVPLGAGVSAGELLGEVDDPFRNTRHPVIAATGGLVIGRAQSPLVNEGDAIFHIARFPGDSDSLEEDIANFREEQAAAQEHDLEPSIV